MSRCLAESSIVGCFTAPVTLNAGPLAMIFDGVDLRYITTDGCEVIRRIYGAVRDQNWCTVEPAISEFRTHIQPDRFRISYVSTHQRDDIDFVWRAEIEGDSDATIRFTFDGEARTTFRRNRIGLCVLHPDSCAGMRCRVERASGPTAELAFPRLIEAEQPVPGFSDLTAFSYEIASGVWARIELEGDQFEMEDQRNWIDASFKTYSTPLHLPFPIQVTAGQRIPQQIAIEISGPHPNISAGPAAPAEIDFESSSARPLLPLGLGASSFSEPLSALALERLRRLHLKHLRIDASLG